MPSFAKIISFAAIAFGTLASAAPLSGASALSDVESKLPVAVPDLPVPVPDLPLVSRDGAPTSLPCVLTDTKTKLDVVVTQFTFITSSNATSDVLGPIVDQVVKIVQDAVTQLNTLVGQSADTILVNAEGTANVAINDVAGLLASIICLVFTALGHVLDLVGIQLDVIIKILGPIVNIIVSLLSIVLELVGGILGDLISVLLPLISAVLPIILKLNVTALISLLGIKL